MCSTGVVYGAIPPSTKHGVAIEAVTDFPKLLSLLEIFSKPLRLFYKYLIT